MSEMIERLVLASFKAWQAHNEDKQKFTLDDMSDEEREFARFHARSMLEAIREPTAAMVDAAMANDKTSMPLARGYDEVWRDMIDETLRA